MTLHAGHQSIASLAHILFLAFIAGDAIYKIRTFASNVGLAEVCQTSAATGDNATAVQLRAVHTVAGAAFVLMLAAGSTSTGSTWWALDLGGHQKVA